MFVNIIIFLIYLLPIKYLLYFMYEPIYIINTYIKHFVPKFYSIFQIILSQYGKIQTQSNKYYSGEFL